MPKAKGGAEPGVGRRGKNAVPQGNRIPTLAELGIDKKISMEAQQLARLPVETQRAIAALKKMFKQAVKEHVQATATRPSLPEGTFRVIYADPPWQYTATKRTARRQQAITQR